MTDQVIYSACYRLPDADAAAFRDLLDMVELWLAHLRGPGGFTGRVVLLTNEKDLPLPDVELVPIEDTAANRKELFRQRPLAYDRLPVRSGERWMQLDADTLAMRSIEPLFARPGDTTLRASPSGLTVIENAAPVLSRVERFWYGRVRGWHDRPGVSACLTSCTGEQWNRLMGPWAAAIRRHNARGSQAPIGDQGFLNLLYMKGEVSVTPLPAGLIYHVRGETDLYGGAAEQAHVLHFPNPWKLEFMKRRSLV